jgi:hypothetical protein
MSHDVNCDIWVEGRSNGNTRICICSELAAARSVGYQRGYETKFAEEFIRQDERDKIVEALRYWTTRMGRGIYPDDYGRVGPSSTSP